MCEGDKNTGEANDITHDCFVRRSPGEGGLPKTS